MAVLHHQWFNLNAQRAYPIDELASGLSDAGTLLPFGILADCALRFPDTYGKFAYLSAISVSPKLVTLCFAGTNTHPGLLDSVDPDPEPESPLLATLSILAPVTEARHYVVTAEKPGVAGWVVFGGNLAGIRYTGRFTSPLQSALLPRCGRSYVGAQVTSLGKLGMSATLSGLVNVLAGSDIQIYKQVRMVKLAGAGDLTPVTALVFSLAPSELKNVYLDYAGPCSGRPESGTCKTPGIISIGGFTGDCAGNISFNLVWPGHPFVPEEYTGEGQELGLSYLRNDDDEPEGGIVLDFKYGLNQTCPGSVEGLPDSAGTLPMEFEGTCEYSSSSIGIEDEPSEPLWDVSPHVGLGIIDQTILFDSNGSLTQFAVVSGSFASAVDTDLDVWPVDGIGSRNIAIFKPLQRSVWGANSIGVEIVATLNQSGHRNAGILFYAPYRGTDPDVPPQYNRYYYIYMDHETDSIGIMLHRMPGPVSPVPEIAVNYPLKLSPAGLSLNHAYKLGVVIDVQNSPDGALGVPVLAVYIALREPGEITTLQHLETKIYDPLYDVAAGTNRFDDVQVGLMAEMSQPRFTSFRFFAQTPL